MMLSLSSSGLKLGLFGHICIALSLTHGEVDKNICSRYFGSSFKQDGKVLLREVYNFFTKEK